MPLIAEAMSDRGRRDGVRVALGVDAAVGETRALSCVADGGVLDPPPARPATGRAPEPDVPDGVVAVVVPAPLPDDRVVVGLTDGAALLPAVLGEAALDAGAAAEPLAVGVAPPADVVDPLEEPVLEEPEELVPEEPVLDEPVVKELDEPVPEELEEPVPEDPVLAATEVAVAGADDWAAVVGAVAAWEAADVAPDAGSVTELTMDPSVLVTGSVTEFTTPETVAVTPDSSDGWLLVAA